MVDTLLPPQPILTFGAIFEISQHELLLYEIV